ncbi:PREDICTED: uncharacterized protein LOC101296267 [Fragaria vesca subsp. vesca]|uniref:uncharacterized protein LOC101296267 n=1 Tax=Fragaria vesca subsp. vesca TaxID=101020 RepID=UPI0002C31EF0|nr:PREDICTED: uncharacterized protein LOC101296267 [Fragaria vesca subsp. vesca]
MSTAKATTRKRRAAEPELTKSADLDLYIDLSSDIKGIMSALQQIREKAHKDGLKKNEETISSVAAEVRSVIDELKSKVEKDRQSFAKSLSKSSKECENCLKIETTKFQAVYEKFCKDQANHLQTLKGIISNFEEEKERLFTRYEQLRKRERTMISEHEKACTDKISKLEESLKKKKQDNKTFSVLRKTLGSFLDDDASDEEGVPLDD